MSPIVIVFAVAAGLWLGLFGLWLFMLSYPTRRTTARRWRRAGYIPVSRRVYGYVNPATGGDLATSTGCSTPPGKAWADAAELRTRLGGNKTTARTYYFSVQVPRPGGPTTDARRKTK